MDSPFLGQIQSFGFNFAPYGWALCQGQIQAISSNAALFSLLGTAFGGNGTSTFGLPDLQGRSMVGTGQGVGLSDITWGEVGGTENVSILVSNMAAHTHTATATSTLYGESVAGAHADPTGNLLAQLPAAYAAVGAGTNVAFDSTAVASSVTVGNAGGSVPVAIRNPYLGITMCIALQGIFPTRN
jgi:microcystin-dependent protein